ncbi:histidine kinase/DNA gyrase B/HSP90-like ATPase [Rhizobium sp. ERR 922]|uniref:ATP-binding protein n=1 Tax=unclassified Rhizobium TaxID=2613769 RepID=UPI0011A24A19|nr:MULTISPECIES: ATP-binding protein [unclassified Rhizobium]TWB45554.1 histidine kinase/DNA gyrase B/HSP90-like ATPase [Rhizobium sp. ERR 922]TWB88211.1 histidine kinase/DNA gyrase B/HSP90-like ATPase [Rhizobium sp. ERR 942]
MRTVEITPSPHALLRSLRGLGYSPETALADLVDNSLAAGARQVRIHLDWRDGNPLVEILDDGAGMSFDQLIEAMRFGGAGPDIERKNSDLGRFGLGLKTASLSQCRELTVASRCEGLVARLTWDVDRVSQGWSATAPDASPSGELATEFRSSGSGTLVSWSRMDRLGGLWGLDRDTFNERISNICAHLAMTFHRFLSAEARRLAISVNGRPLAAWDPFCRWHDATMALPRDIIRGPDGTITARPYILPHRDRFTSEREWEDAGGPGGWVERQGFYVYRGDRLVSAGGWLGLGGARAWTREESSRLARIALDLPPSMDEAWRIDIRKSVARPPAWARGRLAGLGTDCRRRAREVFAWRGAGAGGKGRRSSADGEAWPWEARSAKAVPRYRVRRDHPAVSAVVQALGSESRLLEGLLSALELTVPVERIWLDVAEQGGAEIAQPTVTDIAEIAAPLATLVRSMDNMADTGDRLDSVLRSLGITQPALRAAVIRKLGEN